MHVGFWWEGLNERDHQEDIDVGWRLILKRILEKYEGVACTGFVSHRIETSGGHLCTR
jgi:hypothetical protein